MSRAGHASCFLLNHGLRCRMLSTQKVAMEPDVFVQAATAGDHVGVKGLPSVAADEVSIAVKLYVLSI
jgi:hypothetical protein